MLKVGISKNVIMCKKNVLLFLAITGLAFFQTACSSKKEAALPNVVFTLVDDLGYGDVGCYGATKVQTPNIDRLASEGKMFTDAHSASAVCTPSRYALLTGEYPYRADNGVAKGKGLWGPLRVTSGLIIDTNKLTIADVFKRKGYATAALGKWHLGFKTGTNDWQEPLRPGPQDLGFDDYFGLPVVSSAPPYVWVENDHIVGGDPSDPLVYIGKGHPNEVTPITPIPDSASQRTPNMFKGAVKAHKLFDPYTMGEVLTKKAVDWITTNKQKPFFLYLATPLIHHPFTPAKRFQGTSQCGLYGDYIQELDWMVGEVTRCLADNGLSDNTLVILTSDNGGMFNTVAQRAYIKYGHRENGDLLGFKFEAWEGGQRVPFIARWPGKIEAGARSDQLICLIDMLASFTALTGQNPDTLQGKNSINVLPALLGNPKDPIRQELLLAPWKEQNLSIRKGKWMYIPAQGGGGFTGIKPGMHTFAGPAAATFTHHPNSDIENGKIKKGAPPAQLYDLEKDVNQTTNLYKQYPEIVKEMEATLDTYIPKKDRLPNKKN
jgi:arylsulfatase A